MKNLDQFCQDLDIPEFCQDLNIIPELYDMTRNIPKLDRVVSLDRSCPTKTTNISNYGQHGP